jgi:hypothetical protein
MESGRALPMQVPSDTCAVWFAESIIPEQIASTLYISVILAIWMLGQGKSVCLHTLFAYNAIMTTEQVEHLIIYIYYMAMTLHIAVTEKRLLLYYYGINQNFSMPTYHGINQNLNLPTYHGINQNLNLPTYHGISQNLQSPFISVCQHITALYSHFSHRQFWLSNISRHQSQS